MLNYKELFGWGSQLSNGKNFRNVIERIFVIRKKNKKTEPIAILNFPTFHGRILSIFVNEANQIETGEMKVNLFSADPFLYPGKNQAKERAELLFNSLKQSDKFEYPYFKNGKIEQIESGLEAMTDTFDAVFISRIDTTQTEKILAILPQIAKDNAFVAIDFQPIAEEYLLTEASELRLITEEKYNEERDQKSIFVYQLSKRIKQRSKNQKTEIENDSDQSKEVN
jgi:hypothetical protein